MSKTTTLDKDKELDDLRKQDEVHWKTRRILLREIARRDEAISQALREWDAVLASTGPILLTPSLRNAMARLRPEPTATGEEE